MKKNLIILLISTVFSIGLLEGLLRLTSDLWIKNFRLYDPAYYVLTDKQVTQMKKVFDADTGWALPTNTAFGERQAARDYGSPVMTSFGDSYVYGDELADSETWQSHLAELYKRNVYNFGMSAYGPDQAYLRFKKVTSTHESLKNVPITLLGLTTENINRVVNVYRKFYFPETGMPLTKPRATLKNGQLEFIPNPIQNADEVSKLQDPGFIKSLSEQDGLFPGYTNAFTLHRPYVLNLLHPLFWKTLRSSPEGEMSTAYNFWKDEEVLHVMTDLFVRFSNDVKSFESTPVIALLPIEVDVDSVHRTPRDGYAAFKKICAEKKLNCFNGVEFFAGLEPSTKFKYWLPSGHLSAYGNQVFAKGLAEFLKKSDRQ